VRLVDKVLPQLAHLAPEFSESCSQDVFLQADASRETSMDRIFGHPGGADQTWDYVFNLGGNTAWSRTAEEYKLQSTQLSIAMGKEAAKRRVKVFVEASTGMVYNPQRTPRTEQDKLKPWLKLAKAKLEAEQELARVPGLNLIILRFAHVYGPYDSGFCAKMLCLARVYQEKQEELKWLWSEDLRINTVHVDDAVRALWTAARWREKNSTIPQNLLSQSSRRPTLGSKGEEPPSGNVPIFNIVDHGQTSQGTAADVVSKVFNIKTGFQGSVISQLAKLNLEHVVDDLNEDVLQPWADMLAAKEITKPGPLTPFLEKELLKDTDLSLNGSLFEEVVGFEYEKPDGLTVEGVKDTIASYERMGWWP
jgi:nucleoside-diphosphate-sugar epimerase